MDKKRILIADDQADVLEALRFLLKGGGIPNRGRDVARGASSTRSRSAITTR